MYFMLPKVGTVWMKYKSVAASDEYSYADGSRADDPCWDKVVIESVEQLGPKNNARITYKSMVGFRDQASFYWFRNHYQRV